MNEREKMIAGELYNALDPELKAERRRARDLVRCYNELPETQKRKRLNVLRKLLGHVGERVAVVPPFQVDYGTQVTLEDHVLLNFGCVILDTCAVTIGEGTLVAPGVHFYSATHPIDSTARRAGLAMGLPITVGKDVWIGGGSIVLPGVKIGNDSVIGAGSVVTKDIPAGVVAVGNPCRVIRPV